MNNPLIVGISGKKRAGKDTLAHILDRLFVNSQFTIYHRAFADALKEEVAEALAEPLWRDISRYKPLQDEIDRDYLRQHGTLGLLHHPKYKEHFRPLLQWWGTEFRRKQFCDSYWLDEMDEWIDKMQVNWCNSVLFVTDVRFPNEAEWVKGHNGFLLRVERSGLTDANANHLSETALDDYPYFHATVKNDSSLADLENAAKHVFSYIYDWALGNPKTFKNETIEPPCLRRQQAQQQSDARGL